MRIESEKIAEGLDGDDGAGNGIIFGNRLPEKDLQGFPSTAAEIGQKLPILEKVTAEDFRDAEYEMAVRDLFEHIHAEPFPEFHHALLMAGGTEMPAIAGKGQQIFMAAVFALHTGEAVVQIAAVEVPVNEPLQMRPPETVVMTCSAG